LDLAQIKVALNAKLAAAASKEGLLGDVKGKKRKAEKEITPGNKKIVAPHLQFWTNRHAELHGIPPKDDAQLEDGLSESAKESKENTNERAPPQSFADMNRKCCLLCSRQFNSDAEVNKHERVSKLHRDNMANEEVVKRARTKIAKVAKSQADEADAADSMYRDRAKERRQAFSQPKQPAAQHNKPQKQQSPEKEESVAPAPSKGAALLGKMGWTAGEGLGAQGTGITQAITTELYSQGVGLGAEGGKVGDALMEAERSTKGSYADFLSKSKDKAKERFEKMA